MMKRRRLVITGVLLLLGGAIVNVAVAWGCQAFSPARTFMDDRRVIQPDRSNGYLRAEFSFGLVHVSQLGPGVMATIPNFPERVSPEEFQASIPAVSRLAMNRPLDGNVFVCRESFAGWPFLAVHGVYSSTSSLQSKWYGAFDLTKLISLPKPRSEIPYLPIWPGFAINTIFYAAMLWVVFFAPGMVKRTLRRRRGLCPACAYPIGTSPVCTECGYKL